MKLANKNGLPKILTTCMETFGLSRAVVISGLALVGLVALVVGFWFFHSAPPRTIVITTGPADSIFHTTAGKYAKILARNGVTLKILTSQGSLENLKRLGNPAERVDIGFVQGGLTNGVDTSQLVSLGSMFYEPIFVFYRGTNMIDFLSELAGRRLAIGSAGSGTHALALVLLAANGLHPGGTTEFLALDGATAAQALKEGRVDAACLMGDSAGPQVMRELLHTAGIHLLDFTQADGYSRRILLEITQADGYSRRISYLNKLELPKGCLDFGLNLPPHDIQLIGPTVELIARPTLHPSLSDLLLEAAREVHGDANLFQRRGEFPAPLELEFQISADARRYYTSGKSFLYRYLPFWLASLVNRILVVFVPLVVVVVIPGFRFIPALYKWRIRLGIYRWYRALLALEQELAAPDAARRQAEFSRRLDEIAVAVNKMKVPASFADQFYVLRGHISFVQARLQNSPPAH